jgi:hypothetical protein
MKPQFFKLIVSILILLATTSCYAARVDGPYRGKVVDADTGQPIKGVVVLGTWSKVTVTAGGGVSGYYDAMETVTDKNGDFNITGLGLLVLSNVAPMNVFIFKAGYEYIGEGPWEALKWDGGLLDKKVKWEGDRAIIPLRRLTIEERETSATFPPSPPIQAPEEKIRMMMKEIQKERKERGLD